ncbi:hypothetical protein BGZ67_009930 [Mortierella alpina]|nr:hypothetical protein BGZ67_009930 [Mortierella alpina]
MQPQKDLMLSRRQKTLSSISNYIPIHILLNQPAGVSFSLTVPKSFTIEQLARQIEAEYAYLVEREVGNSSYPVIECGALFDHVDLPKRNRRRLSLRQRLQQEKQQPIPRGTRAPLPTTGPPQDKASDTETGSAEDGILEHDDGQDVANERAQSDGVDTEEKAEEGEEDKRVLVVDEVETAEADNDDEYRVGEADSDDDSASEEDEDEDEDEDDDMIDEREEAESRGVQLRFSDKVEDVLERDSTVHVVNIDQGLGMGRKLSLTNLALAVSQGERSFSDDSCTEQPPGVPSSPGGVQPASSAAQSPHSNSSRCADARETGTDTSVTTSAMPGIDITGDPQESESDSEDQGMSSPSSGQAIKNFAIREGADPRASTFTTDTAMTLLEPSCIPSSSRPQEGSEDTTVRRETLLTTQEVERPLSMCSIATEATSFSRKVSFQSPSYEDDEKARYSSPPSRPRSRATDILLNLESSSNDTRFQEILHNTIALDHFRQFCFQEYSIENLLFWMDVELYAKPSLELLQMDQKPKPAKKAVEEGEQEEEEDTPAEDEKVMQDESEMETRGQFAVQHARYIYLTYIDPCGPLQVNLSDESRTDIPWPILDHKSHIHQRRASASSVASTDSSVVGSPTDEKSLDEKKGDEPVGWPLDRHMFDGAQEHTYQLMKGHTLVRFEDSDLWKEVEKIMQERPEEYANATIKGPLNSYYRPDTSVILSTVSRSRSRHPCAKPQTLYNWNNSTSDLDRSKDKEEALAKTMSQYFGPIPPAILGLGRLQNHEDEEEYEDFEEFDTCEDGRAAPMSRNGNGNHDSSKRLSTASNSNITAGFRNHRFTKRLVGRGKNMPSSASEDPLELYGEDSQQSQDASMAEIDSVENGRRTTRWMVAGYFDDQVRLTAAQRKRLLRRNKKLTKFFGSRVDGSLRPLEENNHEERGFPGDYLGILGSSSSPLLGSPVAYALSSSTIHDVNHKKKAKGFNKIHRTKLRNKMMGSGSDSEALMLLPGGSHGYSSDVYSGRTSGFKSGNLLQKFKRASSDYEDDSRTQNGYRSFGSSSNRHPDGSRSLTRTTSLFSSRKRDSSAGGSGSGGGHHRSLTATDVHQHQTRVLAAHPHPLWSGSLSDQEGTSTAAHERLRGLSLLSIMAASNNCTSGHTAGVTPTTPTMHGFPGMFRGMDLEAGQQSPSSQLSNGGSIASERVSMERHAMYTRRKKADKLSMFFGAQLTPLELSSQLAMEQGDDLSQPQRQQPQRTNGSRSSNESSKSQQDLRVTGPTVSSVNKLSNKDRSILWKRSKKLREILGESLPEAEVALALTRPVLLGSFSTKFRGVRNQGSSIFGSSISGGRRPSVGASGKILRRKRQGSLHGSKVGEGNDGEDEQEDMDDASSEDYEDDLEDDSQEDLMSSMSNSLPRHGVNGKIKGRIVKRSSSSALVRPRRSSTVSAASSARSHPLHSRASRGSVSAGSKHMSALSLESFQTIDSLVSEVHDDGDDYGDDSVVASSTIRRRKSSSRGYAVDHDSSVGVSGQKATPASVDNSNTDADRYRRKKKMDKIQQFMGDRVPEQDLWMGAVGRERTQEMLDMNLLSPTNSAFSFEGNSNNNNASQNNHNGSSNKKKSSLDAGTRTGGGNGGVVEAVSTSVSFSRHGKGFPRRNKNKSGDKLTEDKTMTVVLGGIRMERSLSDPMTGLLGQPEGPQQQLHPNPNRLSTVSRLRQQLSSSTQASNQNTISGIGHLLLGTAASSSPTTAAGPASFANGNDSFSKEKDSDFDTEDDNNSTHQMIPRLRAMSGDDQERFLKRAEKLEKYFGQIPPSKLLESSLTSLPLISSFSSSEAPGSSSSASNIEEGTQDRKPQHSKQRSLFELVGLLSNGKDHSGKDKTKSNSNPGSKRSSIQSLTKGSKGSFKATAAAAVAGSSEDAIESLNVAETPFRVEV